MRREGKRTHAQVNGGGDGDGDDDDDDDDDDNDDDNNEHLSPTSPITNLLIPLLHNAIVEQQPRLFHLLFKLLVKLNDKFLAKCHTFSENNASASVVRCSPRDGCTHNVWVVWLLLLKLLEPRVKPARTKPK